MKHTFYICIAFCALLFAGCADKDIYGAQNETYIEDERPKRNEVV